MPQENTSSFLNKAVGNKALEEIFYHPTTLNVHAEIIDGFSIAINGKNKEFKTDKQKKFIAVEGIRHRYYHIIDSVELTDYSWGKKPDNYFFGFREAIELNLFSKPTNKNNLLLCQNMLTALAFLYVGIPAIHVEFNSVWKNAYFQNIIRPVFPNLIATCCTQKVSKKAITANKAKIFDLTRLLNTSEYRPKDLISYIFSNHDKDDFFEPLWDLYEYIDDDSIINENVGDFTIIHK